MLLLLSCSLALLFFAKSLKPGLLCIALSLLFDLCLLFLPLGIQLCTFAIDSRLFSFLSQSLLTSFILELLLLDLGPALSFKSLLLKSISDMVSDTQKEIIESKFKPFFLLLLSSSALSLCSVLCDGGSTFFSLSTLLGFVFARLFKLFGQHALALKHLLF